MYVRWQSRKRRRSAYGFWNKPDIHWRAVLVENVRIDGKARQRHIAYLGGITESAIALDTPAQRVFFWDKVEDKLSGLKLSPKARVPIIQAITNRVPSVTAKQREQVERRRRALAI